VTSNSTDETLDVVVVALKKKTDIERNKAKERVNEKFLR
jgi:hypothetical protein